MTQYETKDSGERAQFESGMQRDTQSGKPRFDLTQPKGVPFEEQLLTRFARLMGRGAEKYTERNWEQASGQEELDRFLASAFRHFMQWYHGERDEDHAAAVMFNLMGHEATFYKMKQAGADMDLDEGVNFPPGYGIINQYFEPKLFQPNPVNKVDRSPDESFVSPCSMRPGPLISTEDLRF